MFKVFIYSFDLSFIHIYFNSEYNSWDDYATVKRRIFVGGCGGGRKVEAGGAATDVGREDDCGDKKEKAKSYE